MTAQNIVLIVVGISQLIFGFYVLIKGRERLRSWLFFSFAVGVVLWNLSILMIDAEIAKSQSSIVIWDRLSYISVPVMIASMIFYVRQLLTNRLGQELKQNRILWFFLAYSLFCLAITPTNLLSANPGERHMVPGSLYPIFGGYVFLGVLYIVYTCLRGLKRHQGSGKRLFSKILIGFSLTGLGGLIFNIILPLVGYPSLPSLGAASSFFMVVFVGLGTLGSYLFGSFLVSIGVMVLFLLFMAAVFIIILISF